MKTSVGILEDPNVQEKLGVDRCGCERNGALGSCCSGAIRKERSVLFEEQISILRKICKLKPKAR